MPKEAQQHISLLFCKDEITVNNIYSLNSTAHLSSHSKPFFSRPYLYQPHCIFYFASVRMAFLLKISNGRRNNIKYSVVGKGGDVRK